MIDSRHETRPPLIPTWLSNAAAIGWRVLVVFALIVVLADLAVILGTVVASIVFALIVAVLFAPVATRLRGRGWSRTKTAGAVTLLAILVIGLIVVLLAIAVVPLVPGIVEAIQSGLTRLQADASASGQGGQLGDALGQARSNAEAWIGGQLASVASWLATAVTVTILGSILTFFLLQDGDKAWTWALQATGDRRREVIMSSGDEALRGVGVWLRGTATQAAIDAVTAFVFLSVLGIPAALALSIITFFAGFIPYLGGLLVMTVLLVVTYASGGLAAAGAIFVAVILVHVLQTSVVAPKVFRGAVRMPRPAVLIALPIGAAMAGLRGPVPGRPGRRLRVRRRWFPHRRHRHGCDGCSWRVDLDRARVAGPSRAVELAIPDRTRVPGGCRLPRGPGPDRPHPCHPRDHPRGDAPAHLPSAPGEGLEPDERGRDGHRRVDRHHHRRRCPHGREPGDPDGADRPGRQRRCRAGGRLESPGPGLAAAARVEFLRLPPAGWPGGRVRVRRAGSRCVIGALLTFDFMRDGPRFWSFATSGLAAWRRAEVDAAGGRAVGVLGGYMIGTGAISLFGAVTQLVIMTILGIPLALPLAVLSFFGGFIPYIGSILTTGLAFLVTLALGTPQDAAIMGVYTIVFNVVQGNFVAPIVYGRAVNIHPAIVLLAIPAGAALAGIAGMFLVVPVHRSVRDDVADGTPGPGRWPMPRGCRRRRPGASVRCSR